MEIPRHYELTTGQAVLSTVSIAVAFAILGWDTFYFLTRIDPFVWWSPLALVAGIGAADFLSGVIHWSADTWGRDDMPVIGHRLLVPFRVHHVNPDDFLRRSFIDTNGDVAFLAIPVLLAAQLVPLEASWGGPLAIALLGFCAVGAMTNQIHQWAHQPSPPRLVRWLQDARIILGRPRHAWHHDRPYDVNYCIATGWCNGALEALQFFRTLERLVTRLTGVEPRHDDARYLARLDAALQRTETAKAP